jgi:hypothetical protein
MAVRYYPASRIKTGLKTGGNQYLLNGKPYKGVYYLTYKGEAYTGQNPMTGPNELLTQIGSDSARINRVAPRATTGVVGDRGRRINVLQQLIPYYPKPLESDYLRGYFTRYFAKKANSNSNLIEISYDQYITAQEENNPAFEDYLTISTLWQLTGPLNDERVSQFEIRGGVYNTNKRVTENTAKGFRGLVEYIGGDYTKFARIEP